MRTACGICISDNSPRIKFGLDPRVRDAGVKTSKRGKLSSIDNIEGLVIEKERKDNEKNI